MAAIIQYEFNNQQQWENVGMTALADIDYIAVPLNKEGVNKYYVEVLFSSLDDVPDKGLLSAKAIEPIPHKFIGYETLQEFEDRKDKEKDKNKNK